MNKRREIRFQKKEREKEILSLGRMINELRRAAYTPVEYRAVKPIRDGFVRTFVLKEIVSRRKDYRYIKEALEKCNVKEFNRSKKFIYSKKEMKRIKQFSLKDIHQGVYDKLSVEAKKYFIPYKERCWNTTFTVWKPIIPSWMLSVKVYPHYINSFLVYDNEKESEYTKLYNKLYHTNLWQKLDHLLGLSKEKALYSKKDKKEKIIDKEIKKEVEDYIYNK